jgi:LysR family transcriptional regulator, low CO2-responsive transcriptional regulator
MIRSEWLNSFIAFAEELSFTRAALRLHISQPAFHVQIRKLGESLGATLYERVGRGLALTPRGLELLAFARETRDETAAFLDRFSGSSSSGPTVLAAGEGALLYVIGAFLRAHRDPRLRILTRDREGTIAAVVSREAQLGVLAAEAAPEGVRATRLRRAGMVLVMPRGHRLARRVRIHLRDLAGERLIVPPPESRHRQMLTRVLGTAGVDWDVGLEAAGWPLMLEYARLGIGLAIVNDICRLPVGTTARPIPELPPIDYYLVEPSAGRRPEAVERLRARVVDAFKR